MSLLGADTFYRIIGAILAFVAVQAGANRGNPRRWTSAVFWGIFAVLYLAGDAVPAVVDGYALLVLVALASANRVRAGAEPTTGPEERRESARRLGNRLFWPALVVPAGAIVGVVVLGKIRWDGMVVADPRQSALVALGLSACAATVVAWRITRDRLDAPLREGGRLVQAVGWALLLPPLLAALGGVFASAGVGDVVAAGVERILPMQTPFVAVFAYCVGMALFTMCLGNAFAAFPVITLGIGLPFVVNLHHGNIAIVAAIGMLSGYCGTLLTPMAANFNIVPALLLELKDRHAVIRAQVPIGLAILLANILMMSVLAFRF